MAKRKRPRLRRHKRITWGRVTYTRIEGNNHQMWSQHSIKHRRFPSYEAAITHVTNVRLGYIVDPPEWQGWKPLTIWGGVAVQCHKKVINLDG